MTDPLADLIARLEKATEGSRDLDKRIKDEFVGFNPDHDLPKHWPMVGEPGPPSYTTSIDAALTLVPEDCDFLINSFGLYASVWESKESGGTGDWVATGNSLSLALCIAALRARGDE